ncbi:hypothetical protein NQ314_014313 [Rhamnusium bicolor]|uniref:Phenoloxidase-activating factor 2 n=1 Tax=Rhamnusium bicolor TaxID=1586634 RepID=A0AAV8X1Z5_9CUCU|nr:hypothetical protein NQ314_014313 [Rhamnusium bicolor]
MVSFYADCKTSFLHYDKNFVSQQSCQCVPPNLCADNDVAVNGQGLLDIRLQKLCRNHFYVCCKNPTGELNLLDPFIFKGCGYQNSIGVTTRITSNSENAQFGEMPWSVVIFFKEISTTERNKYRCGGSLIHPQIVVTAAHCVTGTEHQFSVVAFVSVRAGDWNVKSQEEPLPHQDQDVQDILIHPHFHDGSLKNDIALLFLAAPMVLTDNIGLICLPQPNFHLEDALCIASGWGKDAFKKGKHSSILRKVDLPLVRKDKCVAALRNTRLGAFYNLHKSFICAGGEKNKDTCKGDGGSPLICPIPGYMDRFLQIGIVSWGIGCGETQTPGVYVNVALYSQWIDEQVSAKNFDITPYKYDLSSFI